MEKPNPSPGLSVLLARLRGRRKAGGADGMEKLNLLEKNGS